MFLAYIHYFRALAIFIIIAGHSIDAFKWDNPKTEELLSIFIANGSVLFVFIAGYLFQHLSVKFEKKKYYTSKLIYVIIPYILISIPAIFIFVTFLERETGWDGFYDHSVLRQVILFYLTGLHLTPLWFIPMIVIFYILAPVLIKADKNKLIYLGLPFFIYISCIFDGELPLENFVHYFSAYLLGMFCSKFKPSINPIISNNIFIISTFSLVIFIALLEFFLLFPEGSIIDNYFLQTLSMTEINYLQKLVMSIFFLGVLVKFNSALTSNYISLIANTSIGIFFIHSYVLTSGKLLYSNLNGVDPSGNLVFYTIVTIATLIICAAIITLIKNIFGKKSKYLIGC